MSTSPSSPPVRNLASPAPKRELIAMPTAFSKGVVPTGFCLPPTFAAPVFFKVSKAVEMYSSSSSACASSRTITGA